MNNPNTNRRLNQLSPRGFTLVEMLLVLVILSTLAAIVYPAMSKHALHSRIIATKTQIEGLRTALTGFEMDNDRFPHALVDLVQRPNDIHNWHGPYLDKKVVPKDAWGQDFIYLCPGKENPDSYDIISMGPDGVEGTEDDITSWQADTKPQ